MKDRASLGVRGMDLQSLEASVVLQLTFLVSALKYAQVDTQAFRGPGAGPAEGLSL